MLPQPAACSSAIWPAKFWSRVDTRAYPKIAIFILTFERDIRINKASENGCQEFYAQPLSFESKSKAMGVSRQVASLAFCAEFGKVTVPAQPCPSGEFSKKVTPGAVGPSLNPIHLGPENRIFITFCPNHSPFLIC